MKNKNLLLLLLLCINFAVISCKDDLKSGLSTSPTPSNLKYMSIADAREGASVMTAAPSVQTGNLTPTFELISIMKSDGTILDESYTQYVSIGNSSVITTNIDPDEGLLDEFGNPLSSIKSINTSQNGIINIANGHNFTVGDYYFNIRVTTEFEGKSYSTDFSKAFHLKISPLLPKNLIYSPKNQNLVHGDANAKTTAPLLPNSNPDVSFELENHTDKLQIDKQTGVVSISPNYTYLKYDTLSPIIKVISNISGEVVSFENKLTTIITDKPEVMPIETIYFFYPTLKTSGSYPTGGEGFSVQVDQAGNGDDIWGEIDNSSGRFLETPSERPATNTAQTVLETQTHNGSSVTTPTASWMVTTTQDLTPFQYGYKLSFNYYYMPAFQTYMADGRTPTDLEVYISMDYSGGDIQDADGNWVNGTWTKVNSSIKCQRSLGTNGSNSSGAPWDTEFIGTPYPGNQAGDDPDGRKKPGTTFYGKWVKCSYDIPTSQISSKFTVAFKVASYFDGELLNKAPAPGRGGSYFLSDFNYKAVEPN